MIVLPRGRCNASPRSPNSTLSTEDFSGAQLVMSPEADLIGDLETAKSTTCMFRRLRSWNGERSWPLSWRSKRQESTATSTYEAEYKAMSTSVRAGRSRCRSSLRLNEDDALTRCASKTTLSVLAPSNSGTRRLYARSPARSAYRYHRCIRPSCRTPRTRSATSRRTRTRATSSRRG